MTCKQVDHEIVANDFYKRLSYTFGNEDWRTERKALRIKPSDRVLCITASGDRPLHLLMSSCEQIVSLDKNPCQSALLALKIAALQELSFHDYLGFLGASPCENRTEILDRLLDKMDPEYRGFWEKYRDTVNKGVLYEGAVEKLVQRGSAFIQSVFRKKLDRLFECQTLDEQREYIDTEWNSFWWRNFFRVAMHPWVFRFSLNDPGTYQHLDPKIYTGDYFFERMNSYLQTHLAKENFFLSWIFKGRVDEEVLPPYLTFDGSSQIKQNLDKLVIQTGDVIEYLEQSPENSFDCYSLSDVSSYLPHEDFIRLLDQILRTARPGARICLRQFLSDHHIPDHLHKKLNRNVKLEEELNSEDCCFYYRFYVGEV